MEVDPAIQQQFAIDVVRRLREANFESLWAGGCVRDWLLGRTPKDYDVATNARPEQVREVFGKKRTLAIGAQFGVIAVLGPRGAGQVEVATFREDGSYTDGRRPDEVVFSSAERDAQRRDFTINGMFFDPVAQQVHDYVGGQHDLKNGVIRAIGDPLERFTEDKLRMLRAVRFTSTFHFALDPATRDAVRSMHAQIGVVSGERIHQELRRMLVDKNRRLALELLRDVRLLAQVLPECAPIADAEVEPVLHRLHVPSTITWEGTLAVLAELEGPSFSLALAVAFRAPYMQAIGSPSASEPQPRGSQRRDAAKNLASSTATRLKLSRDDSDKLAWLLENYQALRRAHERPWSQVQPVLASPHAAELVELMQAEADVEGATVTPDVDFCTSWLDKPREVLDPPPLAAGSDLLDLNVPRGPIYAKLIQEVRNLQLDGELQSRDQALAYLAQKTSRESQ